MGAPGPTESGRREEPTSSRDGLDRMIALAEQAGEEETWAWDALSRFVDGCADLRLDPLLMVGGRAGASCETGVRRQESVPPGERRDAKKNEVSTTPELAASRARLLEALAGSSAPLMPRARCGSTWAPETCWGW